MNKLHIKWQGPYRVIKCIPDQIYRIEHLLESGKTFDAHASRQKYYSIGSNHISDLLAGNIRYQDGLVLKYIDKLEDKSLQTRMLNEIYYKENHEISRKNDSKHTKNRKRKKESRIYNYNPAKSQQKEGEYCSEI